MVGNVKELQGKRTFDELVDRDAAARFLEVSPRTFDRWHLLREGPPRIRYLTAIEDWLSAHETSSPHIANDWQPRRGSPTRRGRVTSIGKGIDTYRYRSAVLAIGLAAVRAEGHLSGSSINCNAHKGKRHARHF
jgi:hypothetical protein